MKATVVDNNGEIELCTDVCHYETIIEVRYNPHPDHLQYFKERVGQEVEIDLYYHEDGEGMGIEACGYTKAYAVPVVDLWDEAKELLYEIAETAHGNIVGQDWEFDREQFVNRLKKNYNITRKQSK